ncbi:MAG: TIGR02172 family protein [Bacteroidaceae bacterium]|nr:TIGR02172 family protein [Bacteroidaceae bacterium]MBR1542473.1 TIGR02172 family protein [Bacteroidaceae bacterium]
MNDVIKINLEDYFQTGEGGTALTYNNKDGKSLAKLFMSSVAAETAIREFHVNQVVYESGLPTPKPIRLITDGTRFGAEYELISPKRSFTRIISQEPDQLVPLSERFAKLARQIHETPADTKRLPDMKELVRMWIGRLVNFPDDLKDRFLRFLDTVPSTPTCLHGDLHIGNIITDGKRDLWIDVGDFAYGAPEWDLSMMYYASHFLSASRADSIFHLDNDTLKAHWDAFAPVYYGTDSKEELEEKVQELRPFIAAKMLFVVSKLKGENRSFSEPLLQIFDKYIPK